MRYSSLQPQQLTQSNQEAGSATTSVTDAVYSDMLHPAVYSQCPFDAHYCHMGTAIKHPVPDRVKPSL